MYGSSTIYNLRVHEGNLILTSKMDVVKGKRQFITWIIFSFFSSDDFHKAGVTIYQHKTF